MDGFLGSIRLLGLQLQSKVGFGLETSGFQGII